MWTIKEIMNAEGTKSDNSPVRLDWVEGMRGAAALAVVVCHAFVGLSEYEIPVVFGNQSFNLAAPQVLGNTAVGTHSEPYSLFSTALSVSWALLYAALIIGVGRGRGRKFFVWKPLVGVGYFSYSLYLVQGTFLIPLCQWGTLHGLSG